MKLNFLKNVALYKNKFMLHNWQFINNIQPTKNSLNSNNYVNNFLLLEFITIFYKHQKIIFVFINKAIQHFNNSILYFLKNLLQ